MSRPIIEVDKPLHANMLSRCSDRVYGLWTLAQKLATLGVQTRPFFWPMHEQAGFPDDGPFRGGNLSGRRTYCPQRVISPLRVVIKRGSDRRGIGCSTSSIPQLAPLVHAKAGLALDRTTKMTRSVSWKRRLIHALDNNAGRALLATLATIKAKQLVHQDVQIGYDEAWHHRFGPYYVPDGPRFDYYEPTVLEWKDEIARYFQEAEDYWFKHYEPRAGDTIVDIGAGRGEHILPFSLKVGPGGKVLAIEAHPETYAYLRRFCKLNRLTNVVPIHAALMDAAGTVQIEDGVWYSNTVRTNGNGTHVDAMTLDNICTDQHIGRIDFLKMNIEGAESQALRGMNECIARVREICVCCHDFRAERGHGEQYRTRDFVLGFLKKNGFSISFRDSDPRDYVCDHAYGTRLE